MNRQPGISSTGTEIEPEQLALLGTIVRKTLELDDLEPLRVFLDEHSITVSSENLREFRDLLIIKRIDLRDLEPAARKRLRLMTLAREDDLRLPTGDYRAVLAAGGFPHCKDCRWFIHAPNDETPNGDKSCVALGTKGIDLACKGFTGID